MFDFYLKYNIPFNEKILFNHDNPKSHEGRKSSGSVSLIVKQNTYQDV